MIRGFEDVLRSSEEFLEVLRCFEKNA